MPSVNILLFTIISFILLAGLETQLIVGWKDSCAIKVSHLVAFTQQYKGLIMGIGSYEVLLTMFRHNGSIYCVNIHTAENF